MSERTLEDQIAILRLIHELRRHIQALDRLENEWGPSPRLRHVLVLNVSPSLEACLRSDLTAAELRRVYFETAGAPVDNGPRTA